MEQKKIIETSELPLGEKVYLKKDFLGWRVVYPIKNEDGTWNWFNIIFGSKSNLLFLIIVFLLGIGLYFGVTELIETYKQIAASPCDYCSLYNSAVNNFNLSLTELQIPK